MKTKIAISALMMGMALPMLADTPVFKVPSYAPAGNLKARTAPAKKSPFRVSKKNAGPSKVVAGIGQDINITDKYGTLTLVLEEDFSLLTTGTEESPDFNTVLTYDWDDPNLQYPWWNFLPQYTHEQHWGVGNAYSAGGSLVFSMDMDNPEAHLSTPNLNLNTGDENGVSVFEFKVRKSADTDDANYVLRIEASETNDMGPTWRDIDEGIMFTNLPTEWTTIRCIFRGAGPTAIYNIYSTITQMGVTAKIYVDDVKVYSLDPKVAIPTVLPHSDYKGTSFNARWNAVPGADKYLLSVYSYDSSTFTNDYVVKDVEVTGTEYTVNNVVSGETYFYGLKAIKGNDESLPSYEWRVYDLETPVLNPAEKTGDWTYKASWNAVPGADVYNYFAYDDRVAGEDGLFVVTDEDFTGILDLEGYPTGWTKEDPQPYTYDDYYCNELKQQGWHGTNAAPYDGYIALDAYHYEYGNGDAAFLSPEMDFSKDGGKFTIDLDLAAEPTIMWDENDNEVKYITQACIAVFNWDETLGDYKQVAIYEARLEDPVTEDWKHYSVSFDKGTDRTVVGIFAVGSFSNLYVDNLKITQNYKKGESLLEPFRYKQYHGSKEDEIATELEINVPYHASGYKIYHKVAAFGRQADKYGQSYDDRESLYTPLEYVCETERQSGIESVIEGTDATVMLSGDRLVINNPSALAVRVYDLSGRVLFATADAQAEVVLPAHGVYMATVGSKTVKVIY